MDKKLYFKFPSYSLISTNKLNVKRSKYLRELVRSQLSCRSKLLNIYEIEFKVNSKLGTQFLFENISVIIFDYKN